MGRATAQAGEDLLPERFRAWFAGRGWQPHPHQLRMLAVAAAGRSALLIAPTGAGKTLAGFLLMEFQRIPAAGDVLEYRAWRFEVLATNGMQITRVAVTPPAAP